MRRRGKRGSHNRKTNAGRRGLTGKHLVGQPKGFGYGRKRR